VRRYQCFAVSAAVKQAKENFVVECQIHFDIHRDGIEKTRDGLVCLEFVYCLNFLRWA
jgi:hypothetical protein